MFDVLTNKRNDVFHGLQGSGKTVRQVAKDKKVLSDAEFNKALDPWAMTEPG